jgi:hypothetical protein
MCTQNFQELDCLAMNDSTSSFLTSAEIGMFLRSSFLFFLTAYDMVVFLSYFEEEQKIQ